MRALFYGLVACKDLCIAQSSDSYWLYYGALYAALDLAFSSEPSSE